MVEIIGFFTIGALVWLLALGMATESDAEKRRVIMSSRQGTIFEKNRQAA